MVSTETIGHDPCLTARQADFLQLTAFVLAQQGRYEKADILLSAMDLVARPGTAVTLARAVLRYYLRDYRVALACLEEIDVVDPIERFGQQSLNDRQKLRRYIKARCYRELGQQAKMRDAVDIYLQRLTRPL